MSFDAHPGSGDFVTRPAVHVIQNIRRPGGDSRGLWPAVPDAWWQPRFSSLTIRSRERLRLNDHHGEPRSEADCADPIRKHYLNCQSRDITTPRSPRSELTGWMSSRANRSRRMAAICALVTP